MLPPHIADVDVVAVDVVEPVGDRGGSGGGVRVDEGGRGEALVVRVEGNRVASGEKVPPVLECLVHSLQFEVTGRVRLGWVPEV